MENINEALKLIGKTLEIVKMYIDPNEPQDIDNDFFQMKSLLDEAVAKLS